MICLITVVKNVPHVNPQQISTTVTTNNVVVKSADNPDKTRQDNSLFTFPFLYNITMLSIFRKKEEKLDSYKDTKI